MNIRSYHLMVDAFLKDDATIGHLPIDDNLLERHMNTFALGRKNRIFADTPKGANPSAIIYSLLVTAKMNKLNPKNTCETS